MARRTLPTVTRYLLGDLLRTLLLTTAVLVTVIAFGAAIKPLSNDRLLTVAQVVKYVALAIVPMMQFALPFSAGFAATLTLHRMTQDNEVLSLSAGGVSYRRLLLPVAGLGLGLLVIMVVLTQWTIPRFWGRMQAAVATDITRIFQATIDRREPFEIGRLQIYADGLAVQEHPDGSEADTRMVLVKGAAAELDDEHRIAVDVTFSRGVVDIYRGAEGITLEMALADTVVYNAETGTLIRSPQIVPGAYDIPNVLRDRLMTRTVGELLALRRNPDGFSEVSEARSALVDALRDSTVYTALDEELDRAGEVRLVQPEPETRHFTVKASRFRRRGFTTSAGRPTEVVESLDGRPLRRYRATEVRFERSGSRMFSPLRFELTLIDCEVADLVTGGPPNRRSSISIPSLEPPFAVDPISAELPSAELIRRAETVKRHRAAVESRIRALRDTIDGLQREIASRLNKRFALCLTAPLLLLLGATLAMWRRESLPLTIYLWAFIPSFADLILISGGDQMMRDGKNAGWVVLWSGNAALLLLGLFAYARLARN